MNERCGSTAIGSYPLLNHICQITQDLEDCVRDEFATNYSTQMSNLSGVLGSRNKFVACIFRTFLFTTVAKRIFKLQATMTAANFPGGTTL